MEVPRDVWGNENNPPHKQQCTNSRVIQRRVKPLTEAQSRPRQNTLSHSSFPPIMTPITTFDSDKRPEMLYVRSACTEMLSLPWDMKPMWAEFHGRPSFIIAGAAAWPTAARRPANPRLHVPPATPAPLTRTSLPSSPAEAPVSPIPVIVVIEIRHRRRCCPEKAAVWRWRTPHNIRLREWAALGVPETLPVGSL